jgi:hypothetical protein
MVIGDGKLWIGLLGEGWREKSAKYCTETEG